MSRQLVNLGKYELSLPDFTVTVGQQDLTSDGLVHALAAVGPDDYETNDAVFRPLALGVHEVRSKRGVAMAMDEREVLSLVLRGVPEDADERDGLPPHLRDLGCYALCAMLRHDDGTNDESEGAAGLQVLGYGILMCAENDDTLVLPEIAFRRELLEHPSYGVMIAILLGTMLEDARNRYAVNPDNIVVASDAPSVQGARWMQELGFSYKTADFTFTALTRNLRPRIGALLKAIGPNTTKS